MAAVPLSLWAIRRPPLSLRGAKRRSNPESYRVATGLLRCARNDGPDAAQREGPSSLPGRRYRSRICAAPFIPRRVRDTRLDPTPGDLPDEASPFAKNISLNPSGKSLALLRASRAHQEGRCASSGTLGAGCDGRTLRKTRRMLRMAKSCGSGAPTLASSERQCLRIALAMVTKKPDHQEEHEISRKTIRAGSAGVSGEPVVT
jgi:hypothetical protein